MKKLHLAAVAVTVSMALTACGSTQEPADSQNSSAVGGPVSVTDDLGRTVSLDRPAQRVAITEWQQIEDVLSLGVTPVGVTDIAGYRTWDTAEPIPDSVTDLGDRSEPNLEAIFSLNPDLVIVEAESETQTVKILQDRGIEVLVQKGAELADPIGNMKKTLTTIATLLGKDDQARAVISEFDRTLADGKAAIAATPPPTPGFLFFDAYAEGANISLRPFGRGSLVGNIGEELGLRNTWTGSVDQLYGLGQTDIEGLTNVGDVTLIYNDTESSDWLPQLQRNAIWNNLAPVKQDRVRSFGTGIWTFGGPKSGEQIVEAFVAAMKA